VVNRKGELCHETGVGEAMIGSRHSSFRQLKRIVLTLAAESKEVAELDGEP
jgi:hypothetical protein